MGNRIKLILISVAVVTLFIVSFFYVSFFGLPWKKWFIGKEILHYLEEKYEEPFKIEKRNYNFKNGTYNITAYPERNPQLTFIAEESRGEEPFVDYYPEVIWSKQAEESFSEIVKQLYPEHQKYGANPVYGEGKIVSGTKIPDYREAGIHITIHISLPRKMKKTDEEFMKMFELIQFAKKNGGNIELFIVFNSNDNEGKDTTYVTFYPKEINKITTIEDVKKFIKIV